jgi:hypothetical protein
MDCYCDYDPPEFYSARIIKQARKQFTCDECRGFILPGDAYELIAGKWDGTFGTFHTCEMCRDLRVWVKNNVPCLCVMHGNMDEELKNAVEEATYRAPQETVGLRFGLLRRMKARDDRNSRRCAA